MHRIKTNPTDLSTLPQGRGDPARLDATTEEGIQNQERLDNAELTAHIGSTLDSLLEEDGILEDVTQTAIGRVETFKSSKSQNF